MDICYSLSHHSNLFNSVVPLSGLLYLSCPFVIVVEVLVFSMPAQGTERIFFIKAFLSHSQSFVCIWILSLHFPLADPLNETRML